MKNDREIIAATDIGTRKVVVLVAWKPPPGSRAPVAILGMGEHPTNGLRKGIITDTKEVSAALRHAVIEAERAIGAGGKIHSTRVTITGHKLSGMRIVSHHLVNWSDGRVRAADVAAAHASARKSETTAPGQHVFARFAQPFFLNDEFCPSPVGRRGRQLKAGYWAVSMDEKDCWLTSQMLSAVDVGFGGFHLSSIASGWLHTTPQDRDNGVLVMDIGAGVTDYVLFRHGSVVATGVLPVGGDHVDEDLCHAFLLKSHDVARDIKHAHNPNLLRYDKHSRAPVPVTGDTLAQDVSVYSVEAVIRARLGEIFSLVRRRLGAAGSPGRLGSGVILTGGVARHANIDEIAARVFQTDIRPAVFPDWVPAALAAPPYSAALGTLQYLHEKAAARPPVRPSPSLFTRFLRMLGA